MPTDMTCWMFGVYRQKDWFPPSCHVVARCLKLKANHCLKAVPFVTCGGCSSATNMCRLEFLRQHYDIKECSPFCHFDADDSFQVHGAPRTSWQAIKRHEILTASQSPCMFVVPIFSHLQSRVVA